MKKNISYISLDSCIAKWLYEKIRTSAPDTLGARELLDGIGDLMRGKAETLMLELSDEEAVHPVNEVVRCKALLIYPQTRKVSRDGKEIVLTPKEFDILYFLARNQWEVFTKEQIYQAVWESEYLLDDSNIMAFIRKLRKKIEPNPDAPEYILTCILYSSDAADE